MKKVLYVNERGLEQMRLGLGFVATDAPFLGYEFAVLVDEDSIKPSESIINSISVYCVKNSACVANLDDTGLTYVSDLLKMLDSETMVELESQELGRVTTEKWVGKISELLSEDAKKYKTMIVAKMKIDDSILRVQTFKLTV